MHIQATIHYTVKPEYNEIDEFPGKMCYKEGFVICRFGTKIWKINAHLKEKGD